MAWPVTVPAEFELKVTVQSRSRRCRWAAHVVADGHDDGAVGRGQGDGRGDAARRRSATADRLGDVDREGVLIADFVDASAVIVIEAPHCSKPPSAKSLSWAVVECDERVDARNEEKQRRRRRGR